MKLAWFNPALVVALSAAAGLVPVYTDLKNPNFGAVAKAMGLWGAQHLESRRAGGVRSDLAREPGPGCCV